MTTETAPAHLTPAEAAAYLGVGRHTIDALIHGDNDFPAVILSPRVIRIPRHALDGWLARRAQGTGEE